MSNLLDKVLIGIVVFIVAIILPALAFLASPSYQSEACSDKAESFEGSSYTFKTGCMVKHNGSWVPLDIIRIN